MATSMAYSPRELIALDVLALLVAGFILRSRFPVLPTWALMMMSSFIVIIVGLLPAKEVERAVNLDVVMKPVPP